jgi:hypothetical protein
MICAMRAIVAAAMFVSMVSAQTPDWFASVHVDLAGFRYPPLARQALISGTVRLLINTQTNEITVESGDPILVASAKDNLAKWKFDPSVTEPLAVDYVFRLSETCTIKQIPRGNSFHRFFLKLAGEPPYTTGNDCEEAKNPPEGPIVSSEGKRNLTVILIAPPAILNAETARVTD